MTKKKCAAIVLAGGQGKRMGTKIQKQYLELEGKPILYYSLKTFEDSPIIDEVILVTEGKMTEYCKLEIVEKYNLTKVKAIVSGGKERYHSVQKGLEAIDGDGYVFIHDGARPFVNQATIKRAYDSVCKCNACVVGMPVKDTIKIVDDKECVVSTPNRSTMWLIQTPQVFSLTLVKGAYNMLMRERYINVTDDAMVVEQMLGHPIQLVYGTYENIKITTPEDLDVAEIFLKKSR